MLFRLEINKIQSRKDPSNLESMFCDFYKYSLLEMHWQIPRNYIIIERCGTLCPFLR